MSYNQFGFPPVTPVVKNLIAINILFFAFSFFMAVNFNIDLCRILGMRAWFADNFQPFQIATYMFMHGDFMHIAINMFVLWMFGSALEQTWGPKRFLFFYLFTGLGAAFVYSMYNFWEFYPTISELKATGQFDKALFNGLPPVVGASGAVFGLLMAYGTLFAEREIYLYFFIPMKAKVFVFLIILFELYRGFQNNPADNVAHFAHLGGMFFGIILLWWWYGRKPT